VSTTAGVLAIGNLQAQIDGLRREAAAGRLTVKARVGLIDLIALHRHVLGRIADCERAGAFAEQLTRMPRPTACPSGAGVSECVFTFANALTDLDQAQRLRAVPALDHPR
jgi:hypothetical protein